jgi:hypothetical protein
MKRQQSASSPQSAWSASQTRAAGLLASGLSIKGAALDAQIGLRTLHTWLDDPAYRAFVASIQDQVLAETIGRLVCSATKAAAALDELLLSQTEMVRLRAALGIIDVMIRSREHGTLAARVAELEKRISHESQRSHRQARGRHQARS